MLRIQQSIHIVLLFEYQILSECLVHLHVHEAHSLQGRTQLSKRREGEGKKRRENGEDEESNEIAQEKRKRAKRQERMR